MEIIFYEKVLPFMSSCSCRPSLVFVSSSLAINKITKVEVK